MRDGGKRGRGQRVFWIHLVVELSRLGDGQHVESEQMGESKGDSQVSACRFEIMAATHIELEKTGRDFRWGEQEFFCFFIHTKMRMEYLRCARHSQRMYQLPHLPATQHSMYPTRFPRSSPNPLRVTEPCVLGCQVLPLLPLRPAGSQGAGGLLKWPCAPGC